MCCMSGINNYFLYMSTQGSVLDTNQKTFYDGILVGAELNYYVALNSCPTSKLRLVLL